ncbi:MAG: alpha/beta hydrolase [Bacteroidales bacterium]
MRYSILLLVCICNIFIHTQIFAQYKPDELGGKFQQRTINMSSDYEGDVICTLVKSPCDSTTNKAILYIHGFNDYFFQTDMAAKFDSAGYNFYALDLRKYGRSYLPGQIRFNVRNLNEYFPDIDSALTIIHHEGNKDVYLMGHSTGGLISALYADARKNNEPIQGVLLNSPFLDQNQSWFKEKVLIPIVSFLARFFPNATIPQGISTEYGQSLHKKYKGEWEYDTNKKLMQSPPLTFSWISAIYKGQQKIHKGLDIPVPVLVLHSDKSSEDPADWNMFTNSDVVLDVKDIEKYGHKLAKDANVQTIPNGLHDLVLSNKSSRDSTYRAFFNFLHQF